MPVTTYTSIDGEIVHEDRGGLQRFYVSDTLGSTQALVDTGGNTTDTYEYWSFGEEKNHVGSSITSFTWLGTLGYYKDVLDRLYYVRARYFRPELARWQTVDPLWPRQPAYKYCLNRPLTAIDPSGLGPFCTWSPCVPSLGAAIAGGCKATNSSSGASCIKKCLISVFGIDGNGIASCFSGWCSHGSATLLTKGNSKYCADGPDYCGETACDTGSGGAIGICPQSCDPKNPYCGSLRSFKITVVHEALHCCTPCTATEEDVEKAAQCIVLNCK